MSKTTLENLINDSDVVSFDVFDTLITRQVLHPEDVFSLTDILVHRRLNIDFNFREIRISAEKKLRSSKGCIYSLSDIYAEIKQIIGISDDLLSSLMNIELEAEEKLTVPRNDIQKLFYRLIESGKKVILVSDMYLNSTQIFALLQKCGYPIDVELFNSCECKTAKLDGSLWKHVIDKYPKERIVHIGDNKHSDYIVPKKLGIQAFRIESSEEKFEKTKMYSVLSNYDNGEFGSSLLLGTMCNKILFNNALSDKYDESAAIGLWNGCIFSCFMRWLINNRDDSLLLFVTRECYILQPMYLEYCQNAGITPQKNCLFYASRQALSRASICCEKDMLDLLNMFYEGSITNFVINKCGYQLEENSIDNFQIKLPRDKEKVASILRPFQPEIISCSSKVKKAYVNYVESCCKINNCNNLTIVDIGYLGTAQFLLDKICNVELTGKYLLTSPYVYSQISDKVYSLGKLESEVHPLYDNGKFFESSIQVPYGQLKEICQDDSGNFSFIFNDVSKPSTATLNAQNLYRDFTNEDAKWYEYLGKEYDYSLSLAEDIWMCLVYFNYLPDAFLNSFSYDDDFNGNSVVSYNPKSHMFETPKEKIPFVFYKKHSMANRKVIIKNIVKACTPDFMFDFMKKIWTKYIK